MTNTLHRFGNAESFRDDYVVFAIASKGKNDQDALPKLRRFLEIALEYKPVNLGDARHGGALRPSQNVNPLSHWKRDLKPDFQAVIRGLDTPTTCAAVFDNRPPRKISSSASKKKISVSASTSLLPSMAPNSAATMRAYRATALVIPSDSKARPKSSQTHRF